MVESIQNVNIEKPITKTDVLDTKFADIKAKQGVLGSIWNEIKELSGQGVSESKCENVLEQYKKGLISFDDALEYIEKFDRKQDNMSDLEANIITGVGAIAVATCLATGPIGWATALLFGAPAGAVIKSGVKLLDRFTNKVKDDEFDSKQILKDTISGAVVGACSAVSSGVGAGIRAGKLGLSVSNGTKCGAQCGAFAGSANYLTNVGLDKDKDFNLQELAEQTLTSTFVAGTVGAVVGAGMFKLSNNVGQEVHKSLGRTIVEDSTSSSSRKVLGQTERNMLAIG